MERQQVRAVDLAAKIAAEFTIHPSVVERALFILGRKGDSYGETPGS